MKDLARAQGLTFTTNAVGVLIGISFLTVVDVNGDSKADLIYSSYNPQARKPYVFLVSTNSGNGTNFIQSLGVFQQLSSPAVGDVNGDGRPDLICNAGTGTLLVLTNNGGGVFGSNATLKVAATTYSPIMATNINGHGLMALISPNSASPYTLMVLTNNGAGIFGSNATINAGINPVSVIVTDVNGDGVPDLICADNVSKLLIFTNNGSGVFGSNAMMTVSINLGQVIAADINGDGKPDLITDNTGPYPNFSGTLNIYTNNGFGIFGSNATLNVGTEPASIVAADINGDGKLDLVSANFGTNTLTVLTNNGTGVFGFNATFHVGNSPISLAAADLNGDGKLDLATASYADSTITISLNTTVFATVPKLTIMKSGVQAIVLWPSSASSFTLQTNDNFVTTNWGNYLGNIFDNGINKSVTNNLQVGNLFFRLKQ